jgi:hypothetical protein
MASEVAKALKRNDAQNRVEDATKRISDKLNISPFQRPLKAKDLTIREYQWYEAIASYLEDVADTLSESPMTDDLPIEPSTHSEKADEQSADSPVDHQTTDNPNDDLLDYSKTTKKDLIDLYPELGLSDAMSKAEMIKAIEDATADG